jgi:hypothetical protein
MRDVEKQRVVRLSGPVASAKIQIYGISLDSRIWDWRFSETNTANSVHFPFRLVKVIACST